MRVRRVCWALVSVGEKVALYASTKRSSRKLRRLCPSLAPAPPRRPTTGAEARCRGTGIKSRFLHPAGAPWGKEKEREKQESRLADTVPRGKARLRPVWICPSIDWYKADSGLAPSLPSHPPPFSNVHTMASETGKFEADKQKGSENGEEINVLNANVETNMRELPPAPVVASEEELVKLEKKLVRKMDLRIMPIIVLLYILNYLGEHEYRPLSVPPLIPPLPSVQTATRSRQRAWRA